MAVYKGFIKNWQDETIMPITRAELVLDKKGQVALTSELFEAGKNGNKFGLISQEDLAKIQGTSGSGQSMADIYDKLGYINEGLYVGNTNNKINFYTSTGVATPIGISSPETLSIGVANNVITFDLVEIFTSDKETTQFIKKLKVDKYGRVINITEGALTNDEIPEELEGKNIKNSTLEACLTSVDAIANNDRAIVNKKYVDDKILEVEGIATGALTFGGSLVDLTGVNNALANPDYNNHYFIIAQPISGIKVADLKDPIGISGSTFRAEPGDTLIVYNGKLVYIPSADDKTRLAVSEEGKDPILDYTQGDIRLSFSKPFTISRVPNSNAVKVVLSKANATTDGYLSKEDFSKFAGYESTLATSFVGEFNASNGYKLGTLTVGDSTTDIFGKLQESSLELTNGVTNAYDPILKFTETDADDVNITIKGINGIKARKVNNDIELSGANVVANTSEQYLKITDGYQFDVKIGTYDQTTKQVSNGLTDYSEFHSLRNTLSMYGTQYYSIENKLTDTSKTYYYGSKDLVEAIALDMDN